MWNRRFIKIKLWPQNDLDPIVSLGSQRSATGGLLFFIKWIKLLLQFPFHFNLSSHFFTATSNQDQSLETLSHPEFSTFYLDSNTREKKGFDSNLMIKVMRVRKRHLWQPIHKKLGNFNNYRRPCIVCSLVKNWAWF